MRPFFFVMAPKKTIKIKQKQKGESIATALLLDVLSLSYFIERNRTTYRLYGLP
jgi:hypothetical protein